MDQFRSLNSRFQKVGDKNVWVMFSDLVRDYNPVNLGQVINCKDNKILKKIQKDISHKNSKSYFSQEFAKIRIQLFSCFFCKYPNTIFQKIFLWKFTHGISFTYLF